MRLSHKGKPYCAAASFSDHPALRWLLGARPRPWRFRQRCDLGGVPPVSPAPASRTHAARHFRRFGSFAIYVLGRKPTMGRGEAGELARAPIIGCGQRRSRLQYRCAGTRCTNAAERTERAVPGGADRRARPQRRRRCGIRGPAGKASQGLGGRAGHRRGQGRLGPNAGRKGVLCPARGCRPPARGGRFRNAGDPRFSCTARLR